MTAIALALLSLSPSAPPDSLPDGKTIDTLSYSFSADLWSFGPAGHLSISADGKVRYSHQTAPSTGSGGIVTQKEWTLTKEERTDLFRDLVAAGLLDTPNAKSPNDTHRFLVSSGKWKLAINTDKVPDKVMTHLRPLLAKAHPLLWGEKPAKPAEKPKLTLLMYTFSPKAEGESAMLIVKRDGAIVYKRRTHPTAPGGHKELVSEEWKIPAKDAEALLDALATDGLFDLEEAPGNRFPNHHIHAEAGRWHTATFPKELPEKIMKHLLPLAKKADTAFWK